MKANPLGIYTPGVPMRQTPPATITREPVVGDVRAFAGGRLTSDSQYSKFAEALTLVAPSNAEEDWRLLNLDSKTLARLTPNKLLELLTDLSPDVSRAHWDFLRMCKPGWTIKAKYPMGEKKKHKKGQEAIDAFLKDLKDMYGAVDIVFNRLFFSAFLRGAFFAELVLDDAGRMPVDLVTPDPCVVRFRKVLHPLRGTIWEAGQWNAGQWIAFDRPTIRYVPVDPLLGSPYGRSLAAPALFTTLFLLGMLHDLRRVVAQQGYPRLHLSINLEKLLKSLPQDIIADLKKTRETVGKIIKEIEDAYAKLEPDDAYVSTDVVDVKNPVGVVDSRSLGAVEGIIRALERQAVRALKTMPLLMGINEATSETHANRQWEIYISGIKSLQHLCEQLLETDFGLVVQAQGIAAVIEMRFAEVRASEEMRDALVEEKKINNAARKRDEGWITQDEAAEAIVGHKAVSQTPIVRAGATPTNDDQSVNDGNNRNKSVIPFPHSTS
jgi:hypothetical protein